MKKNSAPPTATEKRFVAKVLIFLGVVWTLGAIIITTVVDGFMPYGFLWYIMSIGFIVWGAVLLRKNPKPKAKNQKKETVESGSESTPPQPAIPRLYILVNSKNSVFPYMDSQRCVYLYKEEKDAFKFAGDNFTLDLSVLHIDENQLTAIEHSWLRYGVKSVKIYSDAENFTIHPCANNEKDYIGSMVSSVLLRMFQNEKTNITAEQEVEWKTLQSMLAQILKTTPLLVPFKYGDADDESSFADHSLHMTTKAAQQLGFLLKKEKAKELNIQPYYFGHMLLTQGKHGTLWNEDRLVYMGNTERIDMAIKNKDMSLLYPGGNKMMRPMFADNPQIKSHMLAAFTNINDLRRLYPKERVAAFSFEDLVKLTNEGDGIVINPSRSGLRYQMTHSFIKEIKDLMNQPVKFFSLPQEYVGKRKVVLTQAGENKIEVIKVLRFVTGCNLPQAREMFENTPVVVKAGIPLGEAQLIEKLLAQQGAKSEIQMDE